MLSHARGACACTCLLAQHQKLTDTSPQFLDLDIITPLKEHRAAGKEERTTGMIQASPSESVWGPKFRLSSDILMFVMLVFLFVLIGSDITNSKLGSNLKALLRQDSLPDALRGIQDAFSQYLKSPLTGTAGDGLNPPIALKKAPYSTYGVCTASGGVTRSCFAGYM
ncbi:hypothetical protein BKA82DRAFT_4017170 [Pisolithus tinctorius]|nr:hypothetical protein BKA82DRAFT_4017170 [Pisolithus tinctorius]